MQVRHVFKQVQAQGKTLEILRDINFSILPGESVAITGPSGSGKTTLLSIMTGLDVPSSGEVIFGNQNISAMDEDGRARVRAENVGIVFQTFQLLPTLTALENVMLPIELSGNADARKIAQDWLLQVGLLDRVDHLPSQLSGGEQQRVAIARAFAMEPQVLFADEPTGNLDSATGDRIIELLLQLNKNRGTTLVVVTHDVDLAEKCQRKLFLHAGQLT